MLDKLGVNDQKREPNKPKVADLVDYLIAALIKYQDIAERKISVDDAKRGQVPHACSHLLENLEAAEIASLVLRQEVLEGTSRSLHYVTLTINTVAAVFMTRTRGQSAKQSKE